MKLNICEAAVDDELIAIGKINLFFANIRYFIQLSLRYSCDLVVKMCELLDECLFFIIFDGLKRTLMKNYFLSLLLTFVTPLWGQVELKYRELTTQNGLPSNYIINMVQDRRGYVWMATNEGLCRYDGYSFDVLRHADVGNDSLLINNRLRELFFNPNGLLFIRHQGERYSCYDTNSQQFVDYRPKGSLVNEYCDCLFTPEGDTWLWYQYSGCIKISYHEGKIESWVYNKENKALKSNHVLFINFDSHHRTWIGTSQGLYMEQKGNFKCVSETGDFLMAAEVDGTMFFATRDKHLFYADADGGLHTAVQNVAAIAPGVELRGLAAIDGQLVIVTTGTTLCYHPADGSIVPYKIQIPNGSVYLDNVGNYYFTDQNVNLYYFDRQRGKCYTFHVLSPHLLHKRGLPAITVRNAPDGYIYITTIGNGLFVYDPLTQQLSHYSPRESLNSPVRSDYLYAQMTDRAGNLWVSQENLGLSVITAMPRGVHRLYATSHLSPDYANLFRMLRQTTDGRIWAGNFMGGSYLLKDGRGLEKVNIGVDDDMLSVCVDAKGRQWIGTRRSGIRVDGKPYTAIEGDTTSIARGKVFDIMCDKRQRVWIAVNPGALCLAVPRDDGSYSFRRFLHDDPLLSTLTVICPTRKGLMYVGCANGFVVFDPDKLIRNPKDYHYYNSSNCEIGHFEVRDIMEAADGKIWMASAGGGLYRIDNPDEVNHLHITMYTTKHGLADNIANSIVADRKGYLWVSTHYGLSKLDTKKMHFENYFLSADQLGEVYSENSSCMKSDGTLIFATNNGIVSFNPDSVAWGNNSAARLTITNLLVNGTMLGMPLSDGGVRLSHTQNSLTFRFSDMSFDDPHMTEYVYRLEGADKGWSLPTRSNEAVYKDLKPGKYVFHVRKSGDPKEREQTMTVVIRQPWWNTWWAWLFYLTMVGGLAWYIIRLLLMTYSMRNRIKMDREISEFKQRFFMDVSHEFRTPLTLIQGSMEHIRKVGELPAALKQPLSNMGKSTDRMMRLVNQLLEFHKLQSGKLSLSLQETEVIKFLRGITMSFSDLAHNRQMGLQFVPFTQKCNMFIDRGFVDKILYNLLSNAFKYTPQGGDVIVRVREKEHMLVIRVEDTGIGVPKDKQGQLFTRFMQGSRMADSMGIGLHFTQQLVLAHHGNIWYEENPEGGSVFSFSIPIASDQYQPDDYLTVNVMPEDDDDSAQQMRPHKEMVGEPLNDRSVLVVEDDDDVRDYIKGELSTYFKVLTARNGVEALDTIKGGQTPDLVVSDIKMPQMDGIELLKRLRGDDDIFDIPFILLSAIDSIEKQLQGARFGADAYLSKPFSPALLVGKCMGLIRQRDRLRKAYSSHQEQHSGQTDSTAADPNDATTPLIMSERDRKFRNIVDLKINANLANPDFVVDDLAQSTGYGRSQFYAKMMEVTGKTPKEYIRQARMDRAAELLRAGEMVTVAEVAYQVGFSDPLYFSRCFKQHFGMTPSKYQKG